MKKTKTLPQTITIQRHETEPESMELIAKAILDIDVAFKRALNAGGKNRLIEILLRDMTQVSIVEIRKILAAAPKIAETYLTRVR